MVRKYISELLLFSVLWLFGLSAQLTHAQVVIPRDGFPYCEPFTGSSTRANTIFDGSPNPAFLTSGGLDPTGDGVLRLTSNDPDQRGWVFVDLAFSSVYGIKTSFEYFAYDPATPGAPGDGFSFFLFDGNITENDNIPPINPNEFEIGGLGGSLGYSPLRYSSGNFGGGYGLKGAFMGIGLDERGNWGNQHEGKFGGFGAPFSYGSGLSGISIPRYPNAIAIRGPVDNLDVVRDNGMTGLGVGNPATFPDPPTYLSYPFIRGRILFNDPTDGPPYDVLDPSDFLPTGERFTVGSNGRITDCSLDGYRKVFIDLRPDGAGSYTITLDMLVNTGSGQQIVNIFNNVPFPYTAPQNLKVGFAAATGAGLRSVHEIRNVTVEVSSIDPILAPDPPNLDELVCFNEDLTFDFTVGLNAQNQFIRCLQLYDGDPGPPDNAPNPAGDPTTSNCGLSGVCAEKCLPENKAITVPGVGTFESILGELTEGNFDQARDEAQILFTPEPGFQGTYTIYYTVIDNYGLTSFPRTVTVTVNPFPTIDSSGAIIGPTCNGQNDGSISNVVISNLVSGYDFRWEDPSGNVLPAGDYSVSETTVGGYIEATVGVTGVNLGEYTLIISNPVTNNICEESFPFDVTDVRGTPVIVDVDDQQVCEGSAVSFIPRIDPIYSSSATFLWYKDNGKTQPITNGLVEGAVTYAVDGNGVLTITGLPQNAAPFQYFVEVAADPSQNLCATPPGNLKEVQALIVPPLGLSATIVDDLCREVIGSITVNASGGFGTYEYSLDGGPFQSGNVFAGLLPGSYTIDVSAGTNCIGTITETVDGPVDPLSLSLGTTTLPSCGQDNGILVFDLSGGTAAYQIELNGQDIFSTFSVSASGNTFTVSNVPPSGNYTLSVLDANNCPIEITGIDLSAIPIPEFDLNDAIICPGETAVLTPQIIELSNASNLQYSWEDENGNAITSGTSGGITYGVNTTTGELTIDGLPERMTPYLFDLLITGDNLCSTGPLSSQVSVNPSPEIASADILDASCAAGSDGRIDLIPTDPALASDYEYSIDGGLTFQNSPSFTGLIAGSYDFVIQNSQTGCRSAFDDVIVSEPAPLDITLDQVIQPACGEINGLLEINFSGGTPGYLVELFLNGSATPIESSPNASGPLVFQDLAPGDYELRLTDANACVLSVNQTLINDVGIPITVDPMLDAICEGDLASILPVVNTSGNAVLTWYKDQAATDQIVSSPNADADGNIFTIDPGSLELTVEGLAAGNYVYYLVPDGPGYCPSPPFEAEVTVFDPISATVDISNEVCFQAGDGSLVVNASGADGNFEYSLDGTTFTTDNTFFNLIPGDYTIAIRSGNGCSFTTTETVVGPSGEIQANGDILRSSCGEANGSIENVQITGGWGNYSITWRSGSPTGPSVPGDLSGAEDLLPGTYFAIITDSEGCEFIQDFVLEEQPLPNFSITQSTVCEGEDIVLTPVNTVSGSSPTEIFWYKDQALTQPIQPGADADNPDIIYAISTTGELTVQGLPGNTSPYSYYLNVVCGNQIEEAIAQVNPLPTPVLEISDVLCFGETNGTVSLSQADLAEYQNTNYEFTIIQTGETNTSGEFLTLGVGTYDLRIVNVSTTCEATQTLVIEEPELLVMENESFESPVCEPNNGSIFWEISGGTPTYSYELILDGSPVTGFSVDPLNTGFAIDGLIGGSYELIVTDANGCQENLSYTLITQVAPEFEAMPAEICEGENATLTPEVITLGTPASTPEFTWYLDSQGNVPISNGDSDPNLTGVTYSVSSSSELEVQGLEANASPYVYYLGIAGPNTCDQPLQAVEILVNPIPQITFEIDPEQCFGAADGRVRVVGGGSTDYLYEIPGIGQFDQQGLESELFAPGTYTISVNNTATTCENSFSIEVLGPSAPLEVSPLTQIDPGCGEDVGIIRAQIAGGWAPYSVTLFQDGAAVDMQVITSNDYEIGDLAPGDYYLEIVDDEGCQITSNTVTLVYGPSQVLVDNVEICEGEVVIFTPVVNPAVSDPVFSWYFDSGLSTPIVSDPNPDANGVTYQIDSNGVLTVTGLQVSGANYEYYVTADGIGICPGFVANPTAGVFDAPSLVAVVDDVVCFGEDGQITLTATGGNGTFEYSLDGNNFQGSPIFNVTPGTYQAVVRSGGCEGTVTDIVVQGPTEAIVIDNLVQSNAICNLDNGEISFDITGGYGDYEVSTFRDGQNLGITVINGNSFSLTDLLPGSYTFSVVDAGGCILPIDSPITIEEDLTPLLAEDVEICEGEVATLTPSSSQAGITPTFTWYFDANGNSPINSSNQNGVTYTLSPSGELSIDGLDSSNQPYTYYVGISGAGTCPPPLLPVDVLVFEIPNLRVSNPSIVCDPEGTVDLTNFIEGFNPSIYDYLIESPSGAIMRLDEIEDVDMSGDYTVQSSLRNSGCWSPIQRIQVIISDSELIPEFNYEVDLGGGNLLENEEVQIQEPVQFEDISLGKVIVWNWDFGDGSGSAEQNPVHEYQTKGIYTAVLTTIDEFGCIAEFQRVIEVLDDYTIIIPNAFTPNGAKNQYFKPQFRGIASMEFYVFSTWGELLYEANTLEDIGWDGTFNGTAAMNGNYVYRAVFTTRSGERVERAGVFVLIR